MTYAESAPSKLNEDDLIRIALDKQISKLDTNLILIDIKNELSELRESSNKLEAELAASKSVT